MDECDGDVRQVVVVMEQGVTHAHGGLPRISKVPSLGDSLGRHLHHQQVKNTIVPGDDAARHFWIEVIQVEGNVKQDHTEGN